MPNRIQLGNHDSALSTINALRRQQCIRSRWIISGESKAGGVGIARTVNRDVVEVCRISISSSTEMCRINKRGTRWVDFRVKARPLVRERLSGIWSGKID